METIHHHARFMARTDEAPGWTAQFRELVLDVAAEVHDIRGGDPDCDVASLPMDYSASQPHGAALRAAGSEGIAYPSQRDPGDECVGLFYPDLAANVVRGRHLDYHWDGARVDIYRDAGSGEVFRVS